MATIVLRIHLKKGRDGPATLACVRADGTRTWGKEHRFFPVHDLTHCAVESVLGCDEAFFGLIARGWAIDDFTQPGASARLPQQALIAEHIVAVLDRERALPGPMTAAEVNEAVAAGLPPEGRPSFRPISAAQLESIRSLRQDLATRWALLAPGDTLEIEFPVRALMRAT
jgi:hypothetical protein